MFSTRNPRLAHKLARLACFAAIALAGCNASPKSARSPLEPVLPDPPPDEATNVRNFEQTTSFYPNGDVVAWPTYNPEYVTRPGILRDDKVYAAIEPAILVGDAIVLPFAALVIPPWTPITYRSVGYRASMTVAPPLPPER